MPIETPSLELPELATPEINEKLRDGFIRFRETMTSTLSQALASGNYKSVGDALRISLISAVTSNLLRQGLNFLGGALGIGGIPTAHSGERLPGPRSREYLRVVQGEELILTPEQQFAMRGGGQGRLEITNVFQVTGDVTDATRQAIRESGEEIVNIAQAGFQDRGLVSA